MWRDSDQDRDQLQYGKVRARLERFYRHYNPTKVDEIDATLRLWDGRYTLMFEALFQKYGPEPGNLGFAGHPLTPLPWAPL
mmetsp:Transcript_67543/g.78416  ORF Transcript_67543/g.78416 Transcript_67543/m.78416 type:complete len:81 (-) Transcript_67543:18-260(-)